MTQAISILDVLNISKIAIISNKLVAKHYLAPLKESIKKHKNVVIEEILIGDGESYKSQESFSYVLDCLIEKQFQRNDLIIALGGGVVGDLAGFSAACYQRGIGFIQIPTSLLAMVDSSVGGKTAINHAKGKNLIGAFHQPLQVRIDTECLHTLEARQFNAGMAEVIKIAAIKERGFFEWLMQNKVAIAKLDSAVVEEMIYRSCLLKAQIVEEDELEQRVRALLNFGHTFGHAIENLAGYDKILHGEAVAIGMVLAAKFSQQYYNLNNGYLKQLLELLEYFKLPVNLPKGISAKQMIDAMLLDKKNRNNQIRLILPMAMGQAEIKEHSPEQLANFLTHYESS